MAVIKGGNLEVGLALIAASGLVALGLGIGEGSADETTTEASRNVTVNVEGSVITDRDLAHTITAAQAGEYASGY